MKHNISYKCFELKDKNGFTGTEVVGKRIPTLPNKGGVKRIIGRNIIDTNRFLGSYGMGGAGFWGFKLNKKGYYPEEWLVLTIWGADKWLLIDNLWIECDDRYYSPEKCFFDRCESNMSEMNKQVQEFFNGALIDDFIIGKSFFKMNLLIDQQSHILELPSKLTRLSFGGDGQVRKWYNNEHMENGFLISKTPYINI